MRRGDLHGPFFDWANQFFFSFTLSSHILFHAADVILLQSLWTPNLSHIYYFYFSVYGWWGMKVIETYKKMSPVNIYNVKNIYETVENGC